jgi:tRNA1Val (adenine37-N6)-methyltransferase
MSFQFKQFSVSHEFSSMKVGTDAVLLGAFIQTEKQEKILNI